MFFFNYLLSINHYLNLPQIIDKVKKNPFLNLSLMVNANKNISIDKYINNEIITII